MDSYIMLETVLKDILGVINPLQEDWETRLRVMSDLREVVESVESLRGATVEPFGSFVSNLFTRWGDLDISIDVSNGSCNSSAGKKLKQSLLGDLLRALRQKGGCRRLQFVAHARVPILKFESIRQNISCDISIDNLCGQMKSKFLFWISEMDGRFHDMVLLVKEWAKAHDINNPKNGTLNSYSFSLLVIFHFQTCSPAILPPLKDIYPGNLVDDLKDGNLILEINRMLRAGGYFAWAAQPVYKHEEAQEELWKEMLNLTSRLCWELVKKEGYIAIWKKPTNNSCYRNREAGTKPPLCDPDDNPENVWYVDMKACITRLPENGYGANVTPWPDRLQTPPDRLHTA